MPDGQKSVVVVAKAAAAKDPGRRAAGLLLSTDIFGPGAGMPDKVKAVFAALTMPALAPKPLRIDDLPGLDDL